MCFLNAKQCAHFLELFGLKVSFFFHYAMSVTPQNDTLNLRLAPQPQSQPGHRERFHPLGEIILNYENILTVVLSLI